MITIRNRRMIVPNEERYLGVFGDDYASVRVFSISRNTANDIDISALSFSLDFEYKDGTTNTTVLQKIVNDDNVILTWDIIESDLRVEGTVLLQLHGNDLNGTVQFACFTEPFYIGELIDVQRNYTGELSAYEALLTRCIVIEDAEANREADFDAEKDAFLLTKSGEIDTAKTALIALKSGEIDTEKASLIAAKGIEIDAAKDAKIAEVDVEFQEKYDTLEVVYAPRLTTVESQLAEKATEAALAIERERITNLATLQAGSTTGDAELIDSRTSDGITFTNAGDNVRNKITKYLYLLKNSPLGFGTNAKNVTIDGTNGLTKYIVIKNGYTSAGYFGIHGYDANNINIFNAPSDQLVDAGCTYVFKVDSSISVTRIDITNLSNRSNCTVDIYSDYGSAINDVIKETLYKQNINAITYTGGTLTSENITGVSSANSRNIKFTTTSASGNVQIATPNNVLENDYYFYRLKVKASADCIFGIILYGANAEQSSFGYNLIANKEYELYFRTKKFTASGTGAFKFRYQWDKSGVTFEINNSVAVKNSLNAWYDTTDKATMKIFDNDKIVVDSHGYGNFYNLPEAVDFMKKSHDLDNEQHSFSVKDGTYILYPTNIYPYASLNKGANKLSIYGESKHGTILLTYNTATTQSKVIDIGGECNIENCTINSLNDGTYNVGNDLGHNCYSVHLDSAPSITPTKKYRTTLRNVRLYSECHSPLGAGLRHMQTIRCEDVEFVSDGFLSAGATYIHASVESFATDMGVELINCSCVSLDGTKTVTLPNTTGYGALTYADIPVTIQRTIGYTNGAKVTDDNFKTTHKLQPESALNNIADFNY